MRRIDVDVTGIRSDETPRTELFQLLDWGGF